MISSPLQLLILIPIVLLIVVGELIRKRGNPETARRRYFLFLIWTGIGLLTLFTFLSMTLSPTGLGDVFVLFMMPVFVAVVVLILVNRDGWHVLRSKEKTLLLIICLLLVVAQIWITTTKGYGWQSSILYLGAVVLMSAFLWLTWTLGRRHPIWIGLAALLYMFLFNVLEGGAYSFFEVSTGAWQMIVFTSLYLLLSTLVLTSTIVLILDLFQPAALSAETGKGMRRVVELILAFLLIGYFLYTVAWLCAWDGTDDGLRGITMILLSFVISIAAGTVLAMNASGWVRWSALIFPLLVIWLVRWAVMVPGRELDPYSITEQRAARIQKAVEDYRRTTGVYPATLGQLVPRRLLRVPDPMIIPGQEWCYESGSTYYRLGTVYRQHWSSPDLGIRVYASTGDIPKKPWVCDERLAGMIAQRE